MTRSLFLFFILLLTACSWSDKPKTTSFTGDAMTMQYRIIIGTHLSQNEIKKIKKIISATFKEIDRTYNKWNSESEISNLNRSKALQKSPISKELNLFLSRTDKLVKLSEGRFDPTIEALQKLWKTHFKLGSEPTKEQIQEASQAVGWNKIHIENGFLWKDHDHVEMDLGGIAKGYAIDLLVQKLNTAGYTSVYVEWGGELRTLGQHPDGRPWRILISKLGSTDPSSALAIIDMNDNSVASSGDYLQHWTIHNKTYFHIIDPRTSHPLIATDHSICSATILTGDCLTADAIATSAMMFPTINEAEAWLEGLKGEFPELQYWISTRTCIGTRTTPQD